MEGVIVIEAWALIIGMLSGICAIMNFFITHIFKKKTNERITDLEKRINQIQEVNYGDSLKENTATNHSGIINGISNQMKIDGRK